MKPIIIVLLALVFTACLSYRNLKGHSVLYKVYKIDSVNSYYLIYAKKNDSLYKIVSKKDSVNCSNKIRLNNNYSFMLHSLLAKSRIGNVSIDPKNMNVNCFAFDKETFICLEGDSIKDIYHADNVKGLCFIK